MRVQHHGTPACDSWRLIEFLTRIKARSNLGMGRKIKHNARVLLQSHFYGFVDIYSGFTDVTLKGRVSKLKQRVVEEVIQ